MPTSLPPSAAGHDAIPSRQWLALPAVLAAVKLAWFLADHTPMLFLGNSESYLATATIGWIPPDRSFLYGYLLRFLALGTGSLQPLIAVQAACSVVVALLLASLLAGAFAIPKRVAARCGGLRCTRRHV